MNAIKKETKARRIAVKVVKAIVTALCWPVKVVDKSDVFAFAGCGAIVRGIFMWSHPAAFVVGGVILLALSFMTSMTGKQQPTK